MVSRATIQATMPDTAAPNTANKPPMTATPHHGVLAARNTGGTLDLESACNQGFKTTLPFRLHTEARLCDHRPMLDSTLYLGARTYLGQRITRRVHTVSIGADLWPFEPHTGSSERVPKPPLGTGCNIWRRPETRNCWVRCWVSAGIATCAKRSVKWCTS